MSAKIHRLFLRKKSSFWTYFKKTSRQDEKCPEPDLSHLEGTPYRTCGSAYVVQKDIIPEKDFSENNEENILKKIEADFGTKDKVLDPMPPFSSVEQRLIDLTERKLHPLYRKLMEVSPKQEEDFKPVASYKCKCGPIAAEEIPKIFNFDRTLLEKKNIYADFKMVDLPEKMVRRMVEMEQNRKPTLEMKKEEKK